MSESSIAPASSTPRELDLYTASQWQLMWRKLRRHRLAVLGGAVLACFYFAAIFAPFLTLYDPHRYFDAFQDAPPVRVRFADADGFGVRPVVHAVVGERDPRTLGIVFQEDRSERHYLRFFAHHRTGRSGDHVRWLRAAADSFAAASMSKRPTFSVNRVRVPVWPTKNTGVGRRFRPSSAFRFPMNDW